MNRRLVTVAASLTAIVIIGVSGSATVSASVPDPADTDAAVAAFTGWVETEPLALDRIACFVDETGLATCYGLADGLPVAYEAQPTGEGTWGGFTALATAASAGAPEEGTMPNVVCMDLQQAQDTIQAAGVFFSRSEDATGEGWMQIVDRNWIVVAQTPAPGTPIGEGDAVLSVVDDEPSDC
jgi:hypothetical protein